ncbi:hypothetical protein [Sporosarcina sp. P33]|uniref:hypothetical protein n=1 Tax=Sporosarcina sp. P33 TaxID=1930764 RepID=UPI0009BF8DF7|nr:hypothetical protein [Sporosarcina sp. P33]ARD47757.1 hypothetical protein SporoP33_05655 [Sporosarcina sp. P33]
MNRQKAGEGVDSLRKKLQQELEKQSDIQILRSDSWGLRVDVLTITYTTVTRTVMDILMKMILLTIQKLEVSDSKMIAEFLAVDPLFAENLFRKMQAGKMIELRKGHFELTGIGAAQLQSGIFEHPPEKEERKFYYSVCHDKILCEEPEKVFTSKLKPFRLAAEQKNKAAALEDEQLRTALLAAGAEAAEGSLQKVVVHIDNPQVTMNQQIPCVEFYVFNRTENSRFTRVWNTLTEEWDEQLEKLIDEQILP